MRSRIQWWVVDGTTGPHKATNYEWMILNGGHALVFIFLFGFVSEVLSLPEQSRYCTRQLQPDPQAPRSSWLKSHLQIRD